MISGSTGGKQTSAQSLKGNQEFGSLLSCAIPVDCDSRQAVGSEACELRSFSGIQALLNDDEVRSRKSHWDIVADNLQKAGWSCGYISSTDHDGRQFWVVAAKSDGPDAVAARGHFSKGFSFALTVGKQIASSVCARLHVNPYGG